MWKCSRALQLTDSCWWKNVSLTLPVKLLVVKWLKKFKAFCDKAFATGIDNIEKSNESKETGGIFKGKRKGTYLSSMDDASSMRKNKDNNNNDNFKMPQWVYN